MYDIDIRYVFYTSMLELEEYRYGSIFQNFKHADIQLKKTLWITNYHYKTYVVII